MKKIIIFGLVAFVALGTSQTSAHAESVTAETTVTVEAEVDVKTGRPVIKPLQKIREVMNSRKEIKTEARRSKIASSTEAQKSERRENVAIKIGKNLQKMVERFEATISREESIMAKIVSRIEKIKDLGGQTSEAETLVAEAKLNLTEAGNALAALKVSVSVAATEETASSTVSVKKETMNSMKIAGKEIENNLREAHKALQKSVGSLRGVSQLKNASTTTQN
ncbi:MAG: hypothetical protein EXS47_01790 [Candidatus Zambryskibacteria bacterium]|nr:hypothetical protein [Candidatus Zambryskibacteria bacterium]